MFEAIASILVSGAGGGIVGTIGSLFKKRQEIKAEKQKHEFNLKLFELQLEERSMEIAAEKEMAQIDLTKREAEIAGEIEVAEVDAFKQSFIHDASMKTAQWVDNVRALMRPIITVALLAIQICIVAVGVSNSQSFTKALIEGNGLITSLEGLSFLCNMAVSWWFGSRSSGTSKN